MSDLPSIQIRVAGVSFDNRDGTPRQPFVKLARSPHPLRLRREADNPFDANAIAVDWLDGAGDAHQIGYVPRALAEVLAPLVDAGAHLTARVVRRGQAKPAPGRPPLYGVRMAIEGDLSAIVGATRSGIEPMVRAAIQADRDAPPEGLAPVLGGRAS